MSSMKTSWQTETGGLLCRWSEVGEGMRSSAAWAEEAARSEDVKLSRALPDFAQHSLLGSGEWFVPWNLRWSVPGR